LADNPLLHSNPDSSIITYRRSVRCSNLADLCRDYAGSVCYESFKPPPFNRPQGCCLTKP